MKPKGISVIVCCYNSVLRLKPTLEHLFSQQVPSNIDWEIILVDNNSSDNTAAFATDLHRSNGKVVDFRIVSEPKPGLSYARKAGFRNSRFEFALMVDDDNWLCKDYVTRVFETLNQDESIGMVGGLGIAEVPCVTPDWFSSYAYCYATGHQTTDGKSGFTEELYGAGLGLRLSVLDVLEKKGFKSLLSDRVGNTLMSGGDTELCLAFRMAGAKLYYRSDISFHHELPAQRINWTYIRRLFFGFGMSKAGIDMYTACLDKHPQPVSGKFPFWFNRSYYLLTQLLPDIPILIKSKRSDLEGSDRLLKALAKLGQLTAIFQMRNDYLKSYESVYLLYKRLNNE